MTTELAIILGYVALQFVIGWAVSRRIKTEDDYLLGGRRLGTGVAVFTIFATWFGAETCVAAAGAVYQDGLSGGAADPFGYAACMVFLGLVFAVRLWKSGITTLPDLFRRRFGKGVERFAVILMVPTSVLWAAAQIRAFGQVVSANSELVLTEAILLATSIVIAYTALGGFLADAYTDVVQGIILVIGLAILGFVVFQRSPESVEALQNVAPERLRVFGGATATWMATVETWATPILGSVIAQELVARVLATRTPSIARRATLLAAGFYVLIGAIPVILGLIGPTLIPGLQGDDSERFIALLARRELPAVLHLLFVGALVSAILSTVDSALLVAGSLVTHNLVLPLRPNATDRQKIRWTRIAVIISGLSALGLALSAESVHALVEETNQCGSAGVFVLMLLGLFSRIGGRFAGYGALIGGAGLYFAAKILPAISGGDEADWLPYPFLTSLAAAFFGFALGAVLDRRRAARLDVDARASG